MGKHVGSRCGDGDQPKSVKANHMLSRMKAQLLLLNYVLEMELSR